MSEIRDLEGRITAALDRIRAGVAARQAAPVVAPQDADTSDLRAQLDDERTANP